MIKEKIAKVSFYDLTLIKLLLNFRKELYCIKKIDSKLNTHAIYFLSFIYWNYVSLKVKDNKVLN